MIFETEVSVRDMIRTDILKELMAGSITLAIQLNDGEIQNYATQIHNDNSRVSVYGKFNMVESIDGDILTIRPISIDGILKAVPAMSSGISGKQIAVVRSRTKQVENTYPFDEAFMGLELVPSGDKYILKLEYADNALQEEQNVSRETSVVQEEKPVEQTEIPVIQEEKSVEQEEKPVEQAEVPVEQVEMSVVQEENPVVREEVVKDEKVQKIEEELKKDYTAAEIQLDECKKQLEIDKRVLEYYKDKDVKPVEELFKEIQQKLDEAEKQIALFIQAKQQKTMEIEGS